MSQFYQGEGSSELEASTSAPPLRFKKAPPKVAVVPTFNVFLHGQADRWKAECSARCIPADARGLSQVAKVAWDALPHEEKELWAQRARERSEGEGLVRGLALAPHICWLPPCVRSQACLRLVC